MTALRKQHPILVYGANHIVQPANPKIYAYTRELEGQKILVLLNISKNNSTIKINELSSQQNILINNYDAFEVNQQDVILRPYQAVIISLNK